MRILFFVVSLLSLSALAQDGTCKAGIPCRPSKLIATGANGTGVVAASGPVCAYGTNAAWSLTTGTSVAGIGWTSGATSASCTGANSVLGFNVNDWGVRANTSQGFFQSGTACQAGTANCFGAGDGTVSVPAFGFTGDPDTGLYRIGANTLGIATSGTRRFAVYDQGVQLENGTSAAPSLFFAANSTTGLYAYSNNAVGVTSAGVASMILGPYTQAVNFPNVARALPVDTGIGHLWWQQVAPSATTPAVDLAGHPHPVMERRTYTIDVGYESTATPTWLTGAPRVAGSTASITVVDAAAAGASSMGSSPGRVAYRSSVTLASSGSISSLISSVAFVRDLGYAPRWCQKVGQFSAGSIRVWAGLASALPGSSATPAIHHVSFRYSPGDGDTAWQACTGAGGTSCTTTSVAPASAPGSYDLLCIDCREGTAACTWWVNGIARSRQTASLPTNALAPYYQVEARSANAATLYAGPISTEVN